MPYSNCCGAYTLETDYGICPDCREHCEFWDEDDDWQEDEDQDEMETL